MSMLLTGVGQPTVAGAPGVPSYLTQEDTSKLLLEDGTGALLTEESS
jgi:hypothetical protein